MTKQEILRTMADVALIPVVRAGSAEEAIGLVEAIREGGCPIVEITLTVPGAIGVIEQVGRRFGADVVVGAGTVLDPETARTAILAGAQFVVSPALNGNTIALCRQYGVAVFPGALTPTEVVTAWTLGADAVKVFPCGSVGGAGYIKSLKAPLPQIEMIPTGGVSLKTAADFLAAGAFALGVGADLADPKLIRDGNAGQVTQRTREYVEIVKQARERALAG
jgi:2-dehydro-3-deoxyphosphogluconate aldolase/(4S)-4-hydroxy-2-oxoglutarate aldolase